MLFCKRKRILVIALVCFMFVNVLAGCGKETTSDSTKETKNTVTSNTSPSNSTQGTTNTVASEAPLKFSIALSNGNNEYILKTVDVNNEKWVKAFNDKFNTEISIKFFNNNNITQDMQLMFASGEITDLILTNNSIAAQPIVGALEAGIFLPLDDLIEKNKSDISNIVNLIPKEAWQICKLNGITYAIPAFYLSQNNRRATYIRGDLLDKYSLKTPKTIDEYVAVLKVFKQNGIKYPYSGRENFDYTDAFFAAYGVSINGWGLDKDGKLVPNMIRPEMKEALAFHNMLYTEGLIDKECLTTKSSDWGAKLFSGNVGMLTHNANSIAKFTSNLKANVTDGYWKLIASPEGPQGFKGMSKYAPAVDSLLINKSVEEPERILTLVNTILSDESQEFFAYGIEGDTYTKKDGKVVFEYPTETIEVSELQFRSSMLNFARDDAYNKFLLPFQPGGNELLDWFKNIAVNEGITTYDVSLAAPQTLIDNPELSAGTKCKLFMEYVSKIFYGQLPADSHDEFVKEYMKRGGDKVIEEVNALYKAGKVYVY